MQLIFARIPKQNKRRKTTGGGYEYARNGALLAAAPPLETETQTIPLPVDADEGKMRAALERLPTVGTVSVSRSTVLTLDGLSAAPAGTLRYAVTFVTEGGRGMTNLRVAETKASTDALGATLPGATKPTAWPVGLLQSTFFTSGGAALAHGYGPDPHPHRVLRGFSLTG